LIAEIANLEIIGFSLRELVKFQVTATHPAFVTPEPPDQMAADEAAGTTHQCRFGHQSITFYFGAVIQPDLLQIYALAIGFRSISRGAAGGV
jgi:hypothetical protein